MHGFGFHRGCARRVFGGAMGFAASGFGPGSGLGGRSFFMGRKLGSRELQLVILRLVSEQPRHGYEIIKALEEISKGYYAPSPGMVYPALTYLEEVGYAWVEAEGSKKRYAITDAGRAKLDEHRVFVDALLAQLSRLGGKMERVRHAFAGDDHAADAQAEHAGIDKARRELRNALVAKLNAAPSPEELKRVEAILLEAARALQRR